jgi:hypothetical protein
VHYAVEKAAASENNADNNRFAVSVRDEFAVVYT